MRLWHNHIIEVLPRLQMLGLWRELNSIYKLQNRHILINFVYDYPKEDLFEYSNRVIKVMEDRGYKINLKNYDEYFKDIDCDVSIEYPFADKMNDRYLLQCYTNLEEKYDCGGISEVEWNKIKHRLDWLFG